MIKKWHLKAIVQKTISLFPYKHSINYLFQRYVTKGVVLSDKLFLDKLEHLKKHVSIQETYINDDVNMLEIGTGWYPIIPIGMFLMGRKNVSTFDIVKLVTSKRIKDTLVFFVNWHENGKLRDYLPNYNVQALERLRSDVNSTRELNLADYGISYISGNFTDQFRGDEKFNYICSNNTFEHIYENDLNITLSIFYTILEKGGVMSHHIDLSDHFAHLDRTITPYNFLQFSDFQWKLIDNSIQPQNRLRYSDYKSMIENAGFEIVASENISEAKDSLSRVNLNSRFSKYEKEDIAITHSYLTIKK